MSNHKYEKVNYEIYPMKSLNIYLGLIASFTGIVTAIFLLEGYWRIISVMGLVIILLLLFLIKVFLRLRTIKNTYNQIVDELDLANDNRETLANMVDEKNKELELLRSELFISTAKTKLFIRIAYSGIELPERKIVEDALEIDGKGVTVNGS